MAKAKDLIGMRFGKLTVVHQVPKPEDRKQEGIYWLCLCDCGNECIKFGYDLTKTRYKEKYCGKCKAEDLIGQKFGSLTVKHRGENATDGHAQWWCECDCGNPELVLVRSNALKYGQTKTCGKCCWFKDLTGQIFGRWTVVSRGEDYVDKDNRHFRRWWCKCSCQLELPEEEQKQHLIFERSLIDGLSTSCGCYWRYVIKQVNKKYNKYDLSGEYGIGYTFKGEEFYFDLEDYDKIKDYCWHIDPQYGYVVSGQRYRPDIRFHRLVMNIMDRPDIIVDHIHGINSRNDNRKGNLRYADYSKNAMNKRKGKNNKSGTTGVCWSEYHSKWRAYIMINQKNIDLGFFDEDKYDDAVKVRKEAEEKYFGEWSYDNSQKHDINKTK